MKTEKFYDVAVIVADGIRGIYTAQHVAEVTPKEQWIDLSSEDHDILLAGPTHDEYLDVWGELDGKQFEANGNTYEIHQIEGDIWAVPADIEVVGWPI